VAAADGGGDGGDNGGGGSSFEASVFLSLALSLTTMAFSLWTSTPPSAAILNGVLEEGRGVTEEGVVERDRSKFMRARAPLLRGRGRFEKGVQVTRSSVCVLWA
jgi:hypothetical protein